MQQLRRIEVVEKDYKRMCKKCHYNFDSDSYKRKQNGRWGGDAKCV